MNHTQPNLRTKRISEVPSIKITTCRKCESHEWHVFFFNFRKSSTQKEIMHLRTGSRKITFSLKILILNWIPKFKFNKKKNFRSVKLRIKLLNFIIGVKILDRIDAAISILTIYSVHRTCGDNLRNLITNEQRERLGSERRRGESPQSRRN